MEDRQDRPPDKTLTLKPKQRFSIGTTVIVECECTEAGQIRARVWCENGHVRIVKQGTIDDTLNTDLSEI